MIWIIVIAVMVLSFIIQQTLQGRMDKYSRVATNATGAEVAARMLAAHGITDVQITCIQGRLTDHYNPETKTVNLSQETYYGRHLAAVAVAAHECGHVVQHATGYAPLRLRTAVVPVVSFAGKTVQWVLLAGVLLMEFTSSLLWFGIGLFAITTLFSFITLPVEVDASRRAVAWLERTGITDSVTTDYARDALKWAAYTYVIAAIGSLATLLYYIGMASRRS